MRFSIVVACVILGALVVSFVNSALGEYSAVVFGMLGVYGVLMFFKYVMNT